MRRIAPRPLRHYKQIDILRDRESALSNVAFEVSRSVLKILRSTDQSVDRVGKHLTSLGFVRPHKRRLMVVVPTPTLGYPRLIQRPFGIVGRFWHKIASVSSSCDRVAYRSRSCSTPTSASSIVLSAGNARSCRRWGRTALIALLALELSIGRLAWRPYVSDAIFIGAALLLLGGCMARVQRRVPTRVLVTGGIAAYVAVQLIAAMLGIEGVVYVPEWGAFVYFAIACLFWSRPDQSGNRILSYLFAARGAVNLPWTWAALNGFAPYVHSADQVIIVGIGWALVMTELSLALQQNARLLRDLTEREGRIRRLVDANIIGIFIWNLEGRIIEANDAFLRIVGYQRVDLVADWLSWRALTPQELLVRDDQQWVPELRRTGTTPIFEKEYFRKDGSRVPVMIGVASFEIGDDEGVAFVLDLTERKRAEEALHQVQMQLAHSNRVAAVGQLTASIAHELRQPLTAAAINGEAGLQWLAMQPPDLDQVKVSLEEAIKSAVRGGDIISSLMDLTKKQALRRELVDINEAVQEVTVLIQGEAVKHGVSLRAQLAPRLTHIQGDRLQI